MKKLLAIAVTAAFTAAPMVAMADTTAYGSVRMLLEKDPSTAPLELNNNGSRIGFKGSNALDKGLSMTHKVELGVDPTGAGGITQRGSYIGVKGGFGEVRFGSDGAVMDDVDGGAGFLTNGSFAGQASDGQKNNSIKYLGAFGSVGVLASFRPKGDQGAGETKSQIGLTYKAGPFKVAAGVASNNGVSANAKSKIALSYAGANYGVGLVHTKPETGNATNTLGGKYSFGKAYVAGAYGKRKGAANNHTSFELGYGLGKGTKVYYQNKKLMSGGKESGLGIQHNF